MSSASPFSKGSAIIVILFLSITSHSCQSLILDWGDTRPEGRTNSDSDSKLCTNLTPQWEIHQFMSEMRNFQRKLLQSCELWLNNEQRKLSCISTRMVMVEKYCVKHTFCWAFQQSTWVMMSPQLFHRKSQRGRRPANKDEHNDTKKPTAPPSLAVFCHFIHKKDRGL